MRPHTHDHANDHDYDYERHGGHDLPHDRLHHGGGRDRSRFQPGHPHRGPGGGGRRDFGFGPGPGFGPGFRPGPGFGPGRGGRGRARRGDVRLAILSLLADGPTNGYGLIKSIAERSEGTWRPSPGSVYPTLQQLVDEDLILAEESGSKTVYALSETGSAYVAENAETIDAAWAAATDKSEGEDAFQTSVMKLMRVIKPFMQDASDAQRTAAAEKLDETRRALYAILAE
ncbi:PadR family transcriptional regulator [Labedella populi]|uniref:PadR family transcriptional regulator n=1 Tax=Labedella populi TaxID=2498850 RepID=A0A3S4DT01_9MICO|nr:PadR family transcriptional regulator [Labedella populi]RWZ58471.1 PadR family transcriptional regulator [Labedella populi]